MVEKAATPKVSPARRLLRHARAITTPLLPDDYLALLDRRWSAREQTGTIVEVRPETDEASTVVIRPSFDWPGHEPGQYLRIGAAVDGIRHWRAYSITSDPDHPDGLVSVTVKFVEDGRMSPFFVRRIKPGAVVFLGDVEGEFRLPDPLPGKLLMISAGSGITPIMSMVRELARRDALADVVHVHGTRTADGFIFGDMLRSLAREHDGYRLHEQVSADDGRFAPADLDAIAADWRDRAIFASGPSELLDDLRDHVDREADLDRFFLERFQPVIGNGGGEGSGGTVRFRVTDVDAECEPGVSILVGGENAGADLPYGCRMGICHTCVGRLASGQLRDLRTGEVHGEQGTTVRTCVNAPEGHVEIEL